MQWRAVRAFAQAIQRFLDQLQNAPVIIALVKQEFLGVGIGRLVGDILRDFLVRLATVLLGLGNQPLKFFLFLNQLLPIRFDFLLIHDPPYFDNAFPVNKPF